MNEFKSVVSFWTAWDKPFDWDKESIKWMKSRPKVIVDLMLLFPPDCKVKANRDLVTPGPGKIGMVASYFENGTVSVVVPGQWIKGLCDIKWLELVECRVGFTRKDILKIRRK